MTVRLQQRLRLAAVVPALDRKRRELLSTIDHHLQCIGQLILATCAAVVVDDICQTVGEQRGILDKIEPDDRQVRFGHFGLLDKLLDELPVHLHDTEAARILDGLDAERRVLACKHGPQVDIEDRVAENDQKRSLAERLARQIDGVPKALAHRLLDERDVEAVVGADIFLDQLAVVANDDRCRCHSLLEQFVEDMTEYRLAGNVQQDLRKSMRMWSQPGTDTSDRDNCMHWQQNVCSRFPT